MSKHVVYINGFERGIYMMRCQKIYTMTCQGSTMAEAAEELSISKNNARAKLYKWKNNIAWRVARLYNMRREDFDRLEKSERDKLFDEYARGDVEFILVSIPIGFEI